MDREQLKAAANAAQEIADGLSPAYRERCFDRVLERLLSTGHSSTTGSVTPPGSAPANHGKAPKDLAPFLSRTGLQMAEINAVVEAGDGKADLRVYPSAQNKAQGQIQIALLAALCSAVEGNSLCVDPAVVREQCGKLGYYDPANFAATFRKNARLFGAALKVGDSPRRLTLDGERELAKLVRELNRGHTG